MQRGRHGATEWALSEAIKKWEGVVAGTTPDLGSDNCALCKMFITGNGNPCLGCPVMEHTGQILCAGTPYREWARACKFGDNDRATTPELKALAQAELDFLKSLRVPARTNLFWEE
jgi:hypothetical protein